MERRDDIIDRFNDDYTSNVMQYFYCQLQWMLLDLKSRERHYVKEFMEEHLHQHIMLLPVLPQQREEASDRDILTCFKAFQETKPHSATCDRYFYKRYRALLLAKLQHAQIGNPAHTRILRNEAEGVLELWNEDESDPLELMAAVCLKHGLSDIPEEWKRLHDLMSCWHQMFNDTFDWQRDLESRPQTYFLSEAQRQVKNGEPVLNWVAREGFAWAMDLENQWMQEMKAISRQIGNSDLLAYLEKRDRDLHQKALSALEGFKALEKLFALGG